MKKLFKNIVAGLLISAIVPFVSSVSASNYGTFNGEIKGFVKNGASVFYLQEDNGKMFQLYSSQLAGEIVDAYKDCRTSDVCSYSISGTKRGYSISVDSITNGYYGEPLELIGDGEINFEKPVEAELTESDKFLIYSYWMSKQYTDDNNIRTLEQKINDYLGEKVDLSAIIEEISEKDENTKYGNIALDFYNGLLNNKMDDDSAEYCALYHGYKEFLALTVKDRELIGFYSELAAKRLAGYTIRYNEAKKESDNKKRLDQILDNSVSLQSYMSVYANLKLTGSVLKGLDKAQANQLTKAVIELEDLKTIDKKFEALFTKRGMFDRILKNVKGTNGLSAWDKKDIEIWSEFVTASVKNSSFKRGKHNCEENKDTIYNQTTSLYQRMNEFEIKEELKGAMKRDWKTLNSSKGYSLEFPSYIFEASFKKEVKEGITEELSIDYNEFKDIPYGTIKITTYTKEMAKRLGFNVTDRKGLIYTVSNVGHLGCYNARIMRISGHPATKLSCTNKNTSYNKTGNMTNTDVYVVDSGKYVYVINFNHYMKELNTIYDSMLKRLEIK